jgi:hypothetical protein
MGGGGGYFAENSPILQQTGELECLPGKVWCGQCYIPLDEGEFPIAKPQDKEGIEMVEEEDERRYVEGRDGDNLVTSFQCDLCTKRDPVENLPQDVKLLKLIQQANLDALWSREPSTVSSTLALSRQGIAVAGMLGIKEALYQPMGPFPVDDSFGMAAAVVMLQQW